MAIDTGTQTYTMLHEIGALSALYSNAIDSGMLVFMRLLGFAITAPILSRKDFPFTFRLNFALFLTIMVMIAPGGLSRLGDISSVDLGVYIVQMLLNGVIGALVGMVGAMGLEVMTAAGSLMTNQMGLSAAMTFDPSSRQQVSIIDKLLGLAGVMLFFHFNGMHWMTLAIFKTFKLLPLNVVPHSISDVIHMGFILKLSANLLDVGLLLTAPIFVVTIGMDLVLGIVNRTAPQIQVFQLSFALKPIVGLIIFWLILPNFLALTESYLFDIYKNLI